MSRQSLYGTTLDRIWSSTESRCPGFRVYIWNPNRTNVQDVVLGRAESPRYDITPWVTAVDYDEQSVFEGSDDPIASTLMLRILYAPNALPIQITERTLLDGTPIRMTQGDERYDPEQWPVIFTGVIRGNPSVEETSRRPGGSPKEISVVAYDRAEAFLNRVITGRAYTQNTDIGKAIVETAIEEMGLDRREIHIGEQNYPLAHVQNQLVDIEVLKGIYEMLFTVGKKPRFDSEGFLIAADTDFAKAPSRIYDDTSVVESIIRSQRQQSANNSVKVLGLSNELTEVKQREQRLAHVEITSGWFEANIKEWIWFSEDKTRKARDTRMRTIHKMGISGDDSWNPVLRDDGYTCFGGQIRADTGYAPEITALITGTWAVMEASWAILVSAGEPYQKKAWIFKVLSMSAMVSILLIMQKIGRGVYEIFGYPFENVYQQLYTTATLDGTLSQDLREVEFRNDLLYQIDDVEDRSKELLKRELAKGWTYEITILDDPVLEADDIIEIEDKKYYITSIRKTLERSPGRPTVMQLTCWRVA